MAAAVKSQLGRETLVHLYRVMATIRQFEECVGREFRTGQIPGFVHLYIGAEAVAAGFCSVLRDTDSVTSTHRGHGHAIAKGSNLSAVMAEIYGRETGLCRGRGGSMHLADRSIGMLGANAIVGGGIALATGAALTAQVRGSDGVAVAFFGDGAVNQGVLHESLNLAAIWRLPVIFVCENNGYAESTPAQYATSVEHVSSRAAGYGIPGVMIDSRSVLDVREAAQEAVARARGGGGPTFVEVSTFRGRGHFEGDPQLYRPHGEREALTEFDPLPRYRQFLIENASVSTDEFALIDAEIAGQVDEALQFAKDSPWPDPIEMTRYVYAGDEPV